MELKDVLLEAKSGAAEPPMMIASSELERFISQRAEREILLNVIESETMRLRKPPTESDPVVSEFFHL